MVIVNPIILKRLPKISFILPFEIPLSVPDVVIAPVASIFIRVVVYFRGKNAKKHRENIECGSARWADATNRYFEKLGLAERIDHRSYVQQTV